MTRLAEEREQKLWIASGKYVKGEMSLKELKTIEAAESERLKKAISILARSYREPSLLSFLWRW